MKILNILVGCEESQAVTIELRKLGHSAFSCDLLPCSGGHSEWHIQGDIFEAIGSKAWDALILFPPCTFVAGSSVQWLSHPEDKHLPFDDRRPHPLYPTRRQDSKDAIEFFKRLESSGIPCAIENPVGLLSSKHRKPDQIIQPYMFGDEATKTTCLWLTGLPKLAPTSLVGKGERTVFSSGKSHPKWYNDAMKAARTKEERQTLRSKTFPGIAKAMATQWSEYLINKI